MWKKKLKYTITVFITIWQNREENCIDVGFVFPFVANKEPFGSKIDPLASLFLLIYSQEMQPNLSKVIMHITLF